MRSLLILLIITLVISCTKNDLLTSSSASLTTSSDTLKFDTVFTATGSVTKTFRIYNPNDQRIMLSSVKLEGGSASPFSMNINGMPGNEASNIEIAAGDSIHVFVKVTIDPNASNLPFIVRDSIRIIFNGNTRFVQLQSYGQNAVFLEDTLLTANHTWNAQLPYVIIGNLRVDTNAVLNIQPGVRVHMDARASFIIDGILNAVGSTDERISFSGNRLDEPYRNFPGSWGGLTFRDTGKPSFLKFCNIRNAYQGIIIYGMSPGQPKLKIEQSVIDNCYDAGLLAFNASASISNTLISNCGMNFTAIQGGTYQIEHCTFASYANGYIDHTRPVVYLSDYLNVNGSTLTSPLQALIKNSVIWGDGGLVEDELVTSREGNTFNVTLDHSLFKSQNDPEVSLVNSIRNNDPLFDSIDVINRYFDFHISSSFSPAINYGSTTSLTLDLDGLPRNIAQPDLGCYEKQ